MTSVETETEEQQETEEEETMQQARDSGASMCRIHMHEEETRAPLQVKCDWTKRRGPPMHEHFAWS